MKHIEKLLTAAGLPEESVKTVLGMADDADYDPTEHVGVIHTGIETKLKNDPAFWENVDEKLLPEPVRKRFESQQYGRAASIVRQKMLKGLGMSEEDFADLPDDEKQKLETFIPKVAEKFAGTKVSDKQLQAELVAARKMLEDKDLNVAEQIKSVTEKLTGAHQSEKLAFLVLAEMSQIKGLKVPPDYALAKVLEDLNAQAVFEFDGIKAKPKQKANPSLDIVEGTKILSLRDLVVKKLSADNLIEDEAGGGAGGSASGKLKVDVNPDEKGGLAISAHVLDIIEKNKPKEPKA